MDELDASNNEQLERGGLIYRRPDGSHFLLSHLGTRSDCSYNFPPPSDMRERLGDGSTLVGGYHTHPSLQHPVHGRDMAVGCRRPNGTLMGPTRVDPNGNSTLGGGGGGGSPADWNWTNENDRPNYIISGRGRMTRLDPGMPSANRGNNPNRWWWNPPPGAGCGWSRSDA